MSPLDHITIDNDDDAPLVRLGSEYAVPERFTATIAPADPSQPVCHMLLVMSDGRPTCQRLSLEARPGGGQIDGGTLRAVRVAEHIRSAIDLAALWVVPAEDPDAPIFIQVPGHERQRLPSERFDDSHAAVRLHGVTHTAEVKALLRPRRAAGAVTDEKLVEVADVYRSALNKREHPTKAVMEEWNVERSTASRWIKRAREAGHLGAAPRPRVAGAIDAA